MTYTRTAIDDIQAPSKEQLLKALRELQRDLATELRWKDWNIIYWTMQVIEKNTKTIKQRRQL